MIIRGLSRKQANEACYFLNLLHVSKRNVFPRSAFCLTIGSHNRTWTLQGRSGHAVLQLLCMSLAILRVWVCICLMEKRLNLLPSSQRIYKNVFLRVVFCCFHAWNCFSCHQNICFLQSRLYSPNSVSSLIFVLPKTALKYWIVQNMWN